jgi:hypothetical protein
MSSTALVGDNHGGIERDSLFPQSGKVETTGAVRARCLLALFVSTVGPIHHAFDAKNYGHFWPLFYEPNAGLRIWVKKITRPTCSAVA